MVFDKPMPPDGAPLMPGPLSSMITRSRSPLALAVHTSVGHEAKQAIEEEVDDELLLPLHEKAVAHGAVVVRAPSEEAVDQQAAAPHQKSVADGENDEGGDMERDARDES